MLSGLPDHRMALLVEILVDVVGFALVGLHGGLGVGGLAVVQIRIFGLQLVFIPHRDTREAARIGRRDGKNGVVRHFVVLY